MILKSSLNFPSLPDHGELSLASAVPAIYISEQPTELIVFQGSLLEPTHGARAFGSSSSSASLVTE